MDICGKSPRRIAETVAGSRSGSSGAASVLAPTNANSAARFGSATLASRQTAFENLINIWIGVDAIPANARSGGLSLRQARILEQVYGPGYQKADWERAIVRDNAYRRLTEGVDAGLAAQCHFVSHYVSIDWQTQAWVSENWAGASRCGRSP